MSEESFYLAESARVSGTRVGSGAKVYERVQARNSSLGPFVSVGDDSILINADLEGNIAVNRRNFIQDAKVGRFTYTGQNTTIRGSSVGRFCSISWNVSVGGKDHGMDRVTNSALWAFHNMDGNKPEPSSFVYAKDEPACVLGSDVWVATNAVVLRGVVVGDGAVIAAGCVVTRDVEPYTVVAGVPGKVIRSRFPDQLRQALLDLKWWDWPVEIIRENLALIYSTKVDQSVIERLSVIASGIDNAGLHH